MMSKYVPRGPVMHRDQPPQAQRYFEQIIAFTQDVCEREGIEWDAKGRRNYRSWDDGFPTGWCNHFTASNSAVTKSRPIGRIPVLLRRFARRSGSPGVQLIAWDCYMDRYADLRAKYEVFEHLNCDVFCWGLDKAFYHGNDLNGFCIGIEYRNIGRLKKRDDGSYGWGRGGKIDYVGRTPVKVHDFWCEPFTQQQIEAGVLLGRWAHDLYRLEPHKYLGHLHVTSNRTDPYPHFPQQLVRDSIFFDDRPVKDLDWLMAYSSYDKFFERNDEYIEDWLLDPMNDGEVSRCHHDPNVDSDVNIDDLWARVGGEIDVDEDTDTNLVFGEDGSVTEGDVVEAKKALYLLGYYPFAWRPAFTAGLTPEFVWTLKMFQRRWVRRKGSRWVRQVRDTGKVDEVTASLLNNMLRQFDLLPSH